MVEVYDETLKDTIVIASTPAWIVTAVTPTEDFKLYLSFADGSKKVYDMSSHLEWPVFQPLKNPALFLQAHLDGCSVVWNDDLDFAPEELYENGIPLE